MLAATVMVPPPLPSAGVTASQAASSDAVQLMIPPPVLATASVLAAGFAAPCWAVKLRLDGVTDNAGVGGAVTVSVTGIDRGAPPAPGAVMVTVPVWVPGVSPVVAALTLIAPALVPLAGP